MENASESQKEDFNKEEIDPVNLMFIEEQIETLSQGQSLEGECQLTVNPIVEKKVDSDDAENIITEFSPEDANDKHPEESQGPAPETVALIGNDPVTADVVIEEIAETVNSLENAEIQPVTSVASTLTPSSEQVETTEEQKMDEEDKPVKFGKICDPQALGCCEFCGGPVKRRRFCSPVKKFCSKGCARSARKAKKKEIEDIINGQESADEGSSYTCTVTGSEGEAAHKVTWSDYMEAALSKAAPDCCFKYTTIDVPGLKPGMKLEAVDRNNPPSFCVATVIQQVGHRVRIRYDGFGKDSSNDCWCNFQAEELHPIGWCAQNGYPLQPPKGINSSLEDWRTFLTKTLTGALAAPPDLFRKTQEHFQRRVHGFEIGMKLEVVHPLKPSIICPATVTKSLGPYYFAITTDYQEDVSSVTFCCHADSPGIFPAGWSRRHQVELAVPANYTKETFVWEKYVALCRAPFAPTHLFRKMKSHKFKPGMKVEVVDLEKPQIIRVATITNILGRMLQLFFDGHQRFQFVDCESTDIYPIGWCKRTGHPLLSPFGPIPSDSLSSTESEEILDLPSFLEVMERQNRIQGGQSSVGLLPRKISTISKIDKDDKSAGEESDSSDDDTGAERFYHNKNQIFFNKSCCFGPLLDPDKVSQLPEATPPGKVSSVIRTGLEMVAKAAFDPEKVIDLMQEGCGVRVVVKHQGKILKKAISRVDSRPKLERYLKRFCRRLICCEFFLSLKPVPTPCPDQCQADDQGNLQGPKGLKAKRSREYFEVKHLGVEKKKRGRKRKSEYILPAEPNSIITRPLVDNGISLPGAVFTVVEGQTISATVATIAPVQNGSSGAQPQGAPVVPPPAVVPLGSVSLGPPGYQGPPKASVPRPINPVKPVPMLAPQGKLPMVQSHRAPVPINALPGGKPVMKEGVQPHNAPSAPNVTLTDGSSRIVTNVSSQRFETSATSSGTTITFGRAPPNVTISNCVPPPLTKIASDGRSSHVTTTTSVMVDQPNQLSVHAASTVQTASSTSTPPPYPSTGSPHAPPMVRPSYSPVTVGQVPAYRPVTSPPVYARQVVNSGPRGVIRHPGVHPNSSSSQSVIQVKPSSGAAPPPPPLVSNPRVPQKALRPQGLYVPPQSSSSTSASRARPPLPSHPTSYGPLQVRTGVINHRPQGNVPPPLSSAAVAPNTHTQAGTGEKTPSQPGAPHTQRPIIPNYHGIPRSMNLPRNSAPLSFCNVRTSIAGGFGRQLPPQIRPQGTSPGPLQQSFKLRFTAPSVSGTVQQRNVESKAPVTFVDSTLVPKSRVGPTPIKPKTSIEHLQALTNATNQAVVNEEPKAKAEQGKAVEEGEDGESEEKSGSPPKRNLWWLKKKRRKRSRLTYIKTKYRRKDDEGAPSSSEVAPMEMELEDDVELDLEDGLPISPTGEKPKRGRPPKGIGFRFKGESLSNSDPDWDETEERRRVKTVVKKKKGRVKRESTEVLSPKQKSPSLEGVSQMAGFSGLNVVREPGKSPYGDPSSMVRSPPVSPRTMHRAHTVRMLGVAGDKRMISPKGSSSKMMRMNSGPESKGHHSASRFSPYPSSPSSAIASSGQRSIRPKPFCVDVGTNTSLPGCVNGRSPDLPANPVTWSVEQVVRYVRSTDCINYANIFLDQEIDGKALMLLSRDSLMQFTRMKLGPTLKMCSYIAQLKLRAR